MNLFSALQDPAATKMRQAVRQFAEALLELAAEPGAATAPAVASADVPVAQETITQPGVADLAVVTMRPEPTTEPTAASTQKKVDVVELRRLAPTMLVADLAKHFGCSKELIRQKAGKHEIALLPTPRRGRAPDVAWTDAMLGELRAGAGKLTTQELMKRLGVERSPLFTKASELGLSLAMEWTAERSAQLRELFSRMDFRALAGHFGVTFKSLGDEIERQGLSRPTKTDAPIPTRVRAEKTRTVGEATAKADAVQSTLTEGGWIEGAEAPTAEVAEAPAPVLEGISYTITTPDRHPPSPELVEALAPLVEAAAEAMRMEIEDEAVAPAESHQDAVEAIRDRAAWLRETDEEAGRAVARAEPSPVERRKAVPAVRARRPVQGAQKEGASASKWVRLQHPDGRWLHMGGLEWTDKKAASYLVLRTKLPAVRAAFPLANECRVVDEPTWTARDIAYAGAMR